MTAAYNPGSTSLGDVVSGGGTAAAGNSNPWAGSGAAVSNAYATALASQGSSPNAQSYANAAAASVLQKTNPTAYSTFLQRYASSNSDAGFWGQLNKWLPAVIAGVATAGVGSGVGAAVGGGLAGGAAGGAAAGAASTLINSAVNDAPLTLGSLGKNVGIGALGGAIAGSGVSKTATNALSDAGVNPTLASGLVKGTIGAGTGAIKGAVTGTGAETGALTGGIGGITQSLIPATSNLIGGSSGPSPVSNLVAGVGAGLAGSALTGAIAGSGQTNGSGNMAVSPLLAPNPVNNNNPSAGLTANTQPIPGSTTAAPGYDFSSTGSTLGSLLGPVLGTAAGVYGAQNAAEDQTNAIAGAINTQQGAQSTITGANATALGNATNANTGALKNISTLLAPQTTLGNQAFDALGSTLGVNGQPGNYSQFENMPGYQFAVQQGTQAIDRNSTAAGTAFTPNTQASVGQYVTGTAAQDYNTYVSQLMSAAGYGASANSTLAGANLTTAGNIGGANLQTAGNLTSSNLATSGNISQLQQNAGNAQASGVAGGAGAISSLLSKLPYTSIGNGLSGGGSSSSGSDPFAGTALANTPGAIAAYNANNGATAGGIGNLTSGATTGSNSLASEAAPDLNQPLNSLSEDQLGGGYDPAASLTDPTSLDWLNYGGG